MKIKEYFYNFSTYRKVFAIALTTALIITSAVQIISHPVEPVHDQLYLIQCSTFTNWHPLHFERTLSFVYVLSIYNFWAPHQPIDYNTGLRIIAMALYLISGAVLFWSMTGAAHLFLYLLIMTLLYTSRFIFLWNSSELFAGALLMLILWSIVKRMSFFVVAMFIIIFSFAKPELIFCGIIVGIFLAVAQTSSWRRRIFNLCILAGSYIVFLVPVFVKTGMTGIVPGSRSLISLAQHYAVLFAPHQVNPVNEYLWPELEKIIFLPIWGEHKSVWEAITGQALLYYDFIFLSLGHTILNFCRSNLILLAPIAVYCLTITRQRMLKITSLLFLLNFIPIMLLAYMHVRYAARFYPLLLFMILLGLNEVKQKSMASRIIVTSLLLVALVQLYQFQMVFPAGYWFCD
jgi:hypothetical protein